MIRLAMYAGLGLAMVQATACGDDDECSTNSDCPPGRICRIGLCALDPNQTDNGTSDGTTVDVPPLDCRAATGADLVLNEILADPPAGADIDGDSNPSTTEDEFVEVVNIGTEAVAITNVEIDVGGKRAALGAVCLNPNQSKVLFGSGGLPGLTNSGGTVSLIVNGTSVQSHTYGSEAGNDSSITLQPQLDRDGTWVRSSQVWGPPYTPNRCSDLSEFPNCGNDPVVEGDVETVDSETITPQCSQLPAAADLVINEIMADPGSGLTGNDSNGDGIVDSEDDEFVEIVNVSSSTLLLTGVKLRDGGNDDYTFPAGTCVAPNQAIVIFGKYTGTGDFAGVIALDDLGFAVNNSNETLTLLGADGATLSSVTTGSLGGNDQSIVRTTDLDPLAAFVNHSAAPNAGGRKMSPGRCQSGADFPDCGAPPVEVVEGDADASVTETETTAEETMTTVADTTTETTEEVGPTCGPLATALDLAINEVLLNPNGVVDADGSGAIDNEDDEFVEIINVGATAVRLDGLELHDGAASGSRKYTFPVLCLEPNDAVVVFGRAARHYTATGVVDLPNVTGGLGLNNSATGGVADTVSIRSSGTPLVSQAFDAATGESWTRNPDKTGAFVKHKTIDARAASPGQCTSGAALPACLVPLP